MRLAGGEDRPRDAGGLGESDLAHAIAFRDPGEQLVRPFVAQEQRRTIRAQHSGRLGHHALQERVEIQLGRDVRDQAEELHLLGPAQMDVLEVAGAHEGGRRLARHRFEEREILDDVVTRSLVEHLRDADDLAARGRHGCTHDVARRVPGLFVDVSIELRVGVGVVDDQRLPRCEDMSGNADVVEEADLAHSLALHHPRVQLTRGGVVEEQRSAVGVGLTHRHLDQCREHLVERLHRRHRPRYLQQRLGELQALGLLGDGRRAVRFSRHRGPPAARARW